ncbi:hypothetical protein GUJ93_ZPchr0010g11182 [Zizania palustris]|uniref:Uncharacterized protein n=1 Tax=Zizania palustris TaxID=103762 RepID=A0A8J5WFJ1_ZIZPA|nr:hypothetical protein GUJ93_ZPchr0010g11182 [Zizania palustris]KAG8087362.1 hypothetical protein GUJ93_ZPchr0010g11182 [Zizania palustris]
MFSFKSSVREASEMREQLNKLQEELKNEKEEKARALDEIEKLKKRRSEKNRSSSHGGDDQLDLAHRLQQLEDELEAARDSEKKLLLSLAAQTKQLEQTKLSLQELQDSDLRRQPARNLRRRGFMSFSLADPGVVETWSLQRELKLAVEAEEKCKKAMDDLAIALKEQAADAREAKSKLASVQAELTDARTEMEESAKQKLDSDELAAASEEKERGLVDCIKMFEGELVQAREENSKLIESQRVIRDENSRLREMLKHAVSEANVARESLEIARAENSQLKQDISHKDHTLQSIMQEHDSLKVSEAAAQSSIRELKDMIDAMFFSSESTKTSAEASPGDAKGCDVKQNDADACHHNGRTRLEDSRNPAKQRKRTILTKFGDMMKKRNPQTAI